MPLISIDAARASIWAEINKTVVDSMVTNLAQAQTERDLWKEKAEKLEAENSAFRAAAAVHVATELPVRPRSSPRVAPH